jgi:hypothetical protein
MASELGRTFAQKSGHKNRGTKIGCTKKVGTSVRRSPDVPQPRKKLRRRTDANLLAGNLGEIGVVEDV